MSAPSATSIWVLPTASRSNRSVTRDPSGCFGPRRTIFALLQSIGRSSSSSFLTCCLLAMVSPSGVVALVIYRGASCADDAVALTAFDVNNAQHVRVCGHANRNEPAGLRAVVHEKYARIVEHSDCLLERDPMLREVGR